MPGCPPDNAKSHSKWIMTRPESTVYLSIQRILFLEALGGPSPTEHGRV